MRTRLYYCVELLYFSRSTPFYQTYIASCPGPPCNTAGIFYVCAYFQESLNNSCHPWQRCLIYECWLSNSKPSIFNNVPPYFSRSNATTKKGPSTSREPLTTFKKNGPTENWSGSEILRHDHLKIVCDIYCLWNNLFNQRSVRNVCIARRRNKKFSTDIRCWYHLYILFHYILQ